MQQVYEDVQELTDIFESNRVRSVFLVTTASAYSLSGAADKLRPLLKSCDVVRFDASPNPQIEDIERAVDMFRRSRADLVMAVGGGSAIDVAKAVTIIAPQEGSTRQIVEHNDAPRKPYEPFIAIPTTAGTGAESTHFAVIYIDKHKYSLAHPEALASVIVLDPSLTYGLPAHITASCGMDAIAQAIEAHWSVESNDESISYSRAALQQLIPNIERAVHDSTPESRKAMLIGANLSGRAINIAHTTAPHAVSYGFTAHFGVDHGEAVGLTLPDFMMFNAQLSDANCQDSRGADNVKKRLDEIASLFGDPNITMAGKRIESLAASIGLRRKLQVPDRTVAMACLTESIGLERLKNNPRTVSLQDIQTIFDARIFSQ